MGWFFPHIWTTSNLEPQNLTQYCLPNGLCVNNRRPGYSYSTNIPEPVFATALSDLRPSVSLTFQDATTLLYSTTILRVPDSSVVNGIWADSDIVVEAAECGIYLCVKEFASGVVNGILSETSRDISSARDADSYKITISDVTCEGDCGTYDFQVSTDVDAIFSNETYFTREDLSIQVPPSTPSHNGLQHVNVSQAGIDSLSSYILSLFDEGMFKDATIHYTEFIPCVDNGTRIPCAHLSRISGLAVGKETTQGVAKTATDFAPGIMENIWKAPNLTTIFENLANSVTNEMRKNKADQAPPVTGQLGVPRTVLHVRWQWITLPALLLIVSSIFFLLTMIESSKSGTPLWKGSALAVLYHGLEAKVRSTLEHWDLSSQMSDASEEVRVRLRRDPTDDGNTIPESTELVLTDTVLLLRTGPEKTQSMPLMNTDHDRTSSVEAAEAILEDNSDDIPLARIRTMPHTADHGA